MARRVYTIEEDVKLCAGECGRLTRPKYMTAEMAPGTVVRFSATMCWKDHQATKPRKERRLTNPTGEEAEARLEHTLTALQKFNQARAARLARRRVSL